jgi:Flp pilus assembly protein TadG
MKRKLRALLPASITRGQSLVELAISLTVMLLLLAGAVTFGMALFSYVAIRDAAQEGALYGSMYPYTDSNNNGKYDTGEPINLGNTTSGICGRVIAASNSPVNMSGFTCSSDGNSYHAGNNIDVIATTGNACEGTTSVGGVDTPNGVKVAVEYNYPIIMPYIGGIVGSQAIHLRAEVTDTVLEPRCSP